MHQLIDYLSQPWPWFVAGPLIGLVVPLLLLMGNKTFGVSSSFRHACAATVPANIKFLKYDWKKDAWSLFFVVGISAGAFVASTFIANPSTVELAAATSQDLSEIGVIDRTGLVPATLFSWAGLLTLPGFVMIVVGGFLIGFGSRYAGGCTSGHAIMGLSNLQWPSLVAVVGFFVGGLLVTHFLLPIVFRGGQ